MICLLPIKKRIRINRPAKIRNVFLFYCIRLQANMKNNRIKTNIEFYAETLGNILKNIFLCRALVPEHPFGYFGLKENQVKILNSPAAVSSTPNVLTKNLFATVGYPMGRLFKTGVSQKNCHACLRFTAFEE